jgi:hypothetical protein
MTFLLERRSGGGLFPGDAFVPRAPKPDARSPF